MNRSLMCTLKMAAIQRALRSVGLAALLVSCGSPSARATAQVPDYIAAAPGAAEYPQQDGLLLRQSIRIVLEGDGRVTRREETAVKLLTDHLNRAGLLDPRIRWDDARSELKVEQVRTYMADGQVLDAEPNSLVPNTAQELEVAVPHAHLREMTVAHVGVEHGSTSVLAYTISDRRPAGAPLEGAIDLQSFIPILDQEIAIEVPDGLTISWACKSQKLAPLTSTSGGRTAYTFRRKNVPSANLAELPGGRAGIERLYFTTAKSWSEAHALALRHLEAAMDPGGEGMAAVKAKAEEVAGGTVEDLEKLSRIHAFVLDGLQTVRWPLSAFAHRARPAGAVLESSVGHPLEKAVLLASMLRAVGIEAAVALAASEPGAPVSVPCLSAFEEAWVLARAGGEMLWLEATASLDKRSAFHLAGRAVLRLIESASEPSLMPPLEAATNRAAILVQARLAEVQGELQVSGSADLDLGGLYHPLAGFDRGKDKQEGVASGLVGSLGKAKVEEIFVARHTSKALSLRAEFSGGALEDPGDGMFHILVPRVPGAVSSEALQLHRERRTLPLVLPAPACEVVEVALTIPDGFEVAYAPSAVSLSNSAGTFERKVTRDGSKITLRMELAVTVPIVLPGAYEDLRSILAAAERESARMILLRRRAAAQ